MNDKINELFKNAVEENVIENEEYRKWGVKKGLRNEDGTGVLIGLTRIADVVGYKMVDNQKVDDYGELYYRGYALSEIVKHIHENDRVSGFEEIAFLILFGHLPDKDELEMFTKELKSHYNLPAEYLSMNILSNPSMNVMNKIQRSLLMLYELDENPDDCGAENTLRQGIEVIAKMPAIICYAYQSKHHLLDGGSLVIHHVDEEKSIAENILQLLRPDQKYTKEEAELLDLMLVLHIDHGAGNNSTFSNIVVSSTGTDLYSCLAASVGSLKGPKHGGANITAMRMMNAVIEETGLYVTDDEITGIVERLLNKDFFDKSGLVYGIGHAVYTLSDPRCEIIKKKAYEMAKEKGLDKKFDFYQRFEKIAVDMVYKKKGKRVCANVDFYSGLIYDMLGIPEDLFTPMFVCARTVGWIAHNIENKLYCDRIVRPAGKYVGEVKEFIPMEER
ncbi:MAG: citrate synthase [Erysipelotrichaceae bacterium]|nr:citrate synthase [Erysipelotrichaceae bacterium]